MDILTKKHNVNVLVLRQFGLPNLPDTWMTTTRAVWRHVMFLLGCFLMFEYMASIGFRCIGGILPLCETPEALRGLENVARGSINIVVRSQ